MSTDGNGTDVNQVAAVYREQIADLKARLAELSETKRNAGRMAGSLKKSVEELTKERDALKAQVEQLSASPEQAGAKLLELQQQLATYKHREVWGELQNDEEIGLRKDIKLDKAWAYLGYKPDGDPDPKAIKRALLAARESDPILFESQPPAPSPGAPSPAPAQLFPGLTGNPPQGNGQPPAIGLPPGPGSLRGTPDQTNGVLSVTRAQMGDPKFVYENQARIAEAHKKGLLNQVG